MRWAARRLAGSTSAVSALVSNDDVEHAAAGLDGGVTF